MLYCKVDTAVQREHIEHVPGTRYGRSRVHAHLGLGLGHLFVWPMADCARYTGGRVVRVIKFVSRLVGLVWEGLHGNRIKPSN